jgi:superfamily II DNA or RNA helicase
MSRGAGLTDGLWDWQVRAKRQYLQEMPRDFLLAATPGAGKTRFSLDLARELIEAGEADRLAIVVPTDNLRQQWADQGDAYGLPLVPVQEPEDYDRRGYRGCVLSYQQLLGTGADLLRRSMRARTLGILDEIHHVGEHRGWGTGVRTGFERATYRLLLTGTPWRRDNAPIPFVRYDENEVHVDFPYTYGEAVQDGICRPIEFHAYAGEATWRDPNLRDPLVTADLSQVTGANTGIALDTVFAENSTWLRTLLPRAGGTLEQLRQLEPGSGGLVVADSRLLANRCVRMLARATGVRPAVALGDDPQARDVIDDFRRGQTPWLVACRMVSEGIDIPRLRVIVYATKERTPLRFQQICGRAVRGNGLNAVVFFPAVPELVTLARDVQEQLRHVLQQTDPRPPREPGEERAPADVRQPVSATDATLDHVMFQGDHIESDNVADAEAACREAGIPVAYSVAVARAAQMMAGRQDRPRPEAVSGEVAGLPRHREQQLARTNVESLARRLDSRGQMPFGSANLEMRRLDFPPRDQADLDQLREMERYLIRRLEEV